MNKVKTIKQYLKEGPPKFNVINRRKTNSVLHMSIINSGLLNGERYSGKDIFLQIEPSESGLGQIKDVARISDDITFSQGDSIDSEKGNGFVVSFNEDRIHCDVAYFFEQNLVTVDIDSISKTETLEVGDEFVGEDESLGGEKYDLGD
jgi:hypothetical protein